ncbi:hypothetical protein J4Q44_G00225490 [Coregonus suidteri]|uniref:Uncharacterized protein n=1 Tax=Coregonus suidteri TaxID=861788 RepID=A0AAN8QPU9_9TELE
MLSWEEVLKQPWSKLANTALFSGESMSREWALCSRPSCLRSMLRMVAARCNLSWISTLSRRRVSRNSARTFAFHSAAWTLNSPTCNYTKMESLEAGGWRGCITTVSIHTCLRGSRQGHQQGIIAKQTWNKAL